MERLAQKATREQTQRHNSRLVLKTIYDSDQTSRADIARATRLTRTTVSGVVDDLIGQGLVEEVGRGPSEGGRPPILLRVVDDSRHVIGIDLASDAFRGAVVNLRGKIRHQASLPLRGRDGEAALGLVHHLVGDLIAGTDGSLLGIGIGTPGLMDPINGVICRAVNLDWQELPLRSLLEERYGLPVYVANDCHLAAMAEYAFGESRDRNSLVVIKIEHGIGAGIVLNGRLFHGDTFGAGEIGHVLVVENGERCRCGNLGCLETVASVRAIVRQAQDVARNEPHSFLHAHAATPGDVSMEMICQAVEAGDEAAWQVIRRTGRYLGMAAASLVGVLSIRHILIAGSVTCLGRSLLDVIREEMVSRSLGAVAGRTELDMSRMGPNIVILGASALVLGRELGLLAPLMDEC